MKNPVIESLMEFQRRREAYDCSPMFDGCGPYGLEMSPALGGKEIAAAIEALRRLAEAVGDVARASAGMFDVSPLLMGAGELMGVASAISTVADRDGGFVRLNGSYFVDLRNVDALVQAIKLRASLAANPEPGGPVDKLARAIGAIAADSSLALLRDGELAKRLGISRTTLCKPRWKKFRDARNAIRQREAPRKALDDRGSG